MALGITPLEIIKSLNYPLLVKAPNWERVPLASIASVQNGYAFKSEFFNNFSQGMPLIRIRDILNHSTEQFYSGEYESDFIVKYEDILIGMDGDFNISIWKGDNGLLNQRVCRIQNIKCHFFNKDFLFMCLGPYLDAINQETSAVTVKHLSSKTIQDIYLPLPPLNEQKRIVQRIEELFSEIDDGIQSLETAKKQLDIYREAILIQAFEGKLTEEWRRNHQNLISTGEILKSKFSAERKLRYENEIKKWKASVKEWELKQQEGRKPTKPRAPKDVQKLTNDTLSTLPTIPSEWYWDTLGNITSGVEYGTSAKSQESGSVPVIRMGNIQQGVIDWDDLVYTSDEQEIKQYELKAGDVLFNRTNSPELVGKTAIYKGEQPAIFAGYLIRVNHYSNLIDSNFLNYYLNSHIAKTYGNSVKTDGVNQSNINGEKLQNYPFPFCSLEEQLEIVKIISNFLDKEKVTRQYLDSELKRAHLLKQSILQKAFSGQLVPQDSNDEPASVLLERIKAEKEEELEKAKANKAPKKPTKRKTKTTKENEPAQQELI